MKNNKISTILFFISVALVILSFININIYNGIKETIVLRDAAIINELQIIVKDLKEDVTVENVARLKSYSQKIMNMNVSFYKNDNNLSNYSIKLSGLSSEIIKNSVNHELLPELLYEYENTLNTISGIIK